MLTASSINDSTDQNKQLRILWRINNSDIHTIIVTIFVQQIVKKIFVVVQYFLEIRRIN